MIFAHPSEKLFSDHLDLFDIEWIYEPVSFPLEWGSGSIKKMFTPDFYLPSLDLFVEITTMGFLEEIKRRRTFGIISHPDAGKTTLTEKLLLFGGAIQEAGAVKSNKIKNSD